MIQTIEKDKHCENGELLTLMETIAAINVLTIQPNVLYETADEMFSFSGHVFNLDKKDALRASRLEDE